MHGKSHVRQEATKAHEHVRPKPEEQHNKSNILVHDFFIFIKAAFLSKAYTE